MIAGEGVVGIVLALLAVFGIDKVINISGILNLPTWASDLGSVAVFALVVISVLKFSLWKKRGVK